MITTTTSSSISVKPSRRGRLRIRASLRPTDLFSLAAILLRPDGEKSALVADSWGLLAPRLDETTGVLRFPRRWRMRRAGTKKRPAPQGSSVRPVQTWLVSVSVRCAQLAADLAAGIERRRVHVRICKTSADGGDDLSKLAGRNLLACRARTDHVCRGDLTRDSARLRTKRRKARDGGRSRCRRGLAQPHNDAAVHAALGKVNVGLLHRPYESAVGQFVLDQPIVAADRSVESAPGGRRHRRHLVIADQPRFDVLSAGSRGCTPSEQRSEERRVGNEWRARGARTE